MHYQNILLPPAERRYQELRAYIWDRVRAGLTAHNRGQWLIELAYRRYRGAAVH